MVRGVTRPTKRGIPPVIKQEEVSQKEDLKQAWNTVKAAVLQGDQVCTDLVCVSIYDTKPVYFLSNVVEGIEWIEKKTKSFQPKIWKNKRDEISSNERCELLQPQYGECRLSGPVEESLSVRL